jgi:hypothetical protein
MFKETVREEGIYDFLFLFSSDFSISHLYLIKKYIR